MLGISGGGESSQCFLGSFVVVFLSPGFDDRLGVTQTDKPVFVQAFVAQTSVERFDVGILIWFAGLNLPQLHATLMRPKSRGRLFLASANPGDKVRIEPGYINDPDGHDLKRMVEAVRLSRRIFAQDAFAPFFAEPPATFRTLPEFAFESVT